MARNTLKLETKGLEELIRRLDGLTDDVKPVISDALEQASETIAEDTIDALHKQYLPAGGKYSRSDTDLAKTAETVITGAKTTWQGTEGSIRAGFDYGQNGAGGLLISGTPKMDPDQRLFAIYKKKSYMKKIEQDISDVIIDAINARLEGKS